MTQVTLKNLTARQRQAYILRFCRRWRLRRIAVELGIAVSSAGELVKRAQFRAGLGKKKMRVIRAHPRLTRALSLTDREGSASRLRRQQVSTRGDWLGVIEPAKIKGCRATNSARMGRNVARDYMKVTQFTEEFWGSPVGGMLNASAIRWSQQ